MRRVASPVIGGGFTPLTSHRGGSSIAPNHHHPHHPSQPGMYSSRGPLTPSAARLTPTARQAPSRAAITYQEQHRRNSGSTSRGVTPRGRMYPDPSVLPASVSSIGGGAMNVVSTLDDISSRAATAARHIRSSSPAMMQETMPPSQPPVAAPTAALRHDEIRRIVEKVEKHFTPQISQLSAQLSRQKEENDHLRAENEALQRQLQNSQRAADTGHAVDALRSDLQREKRARFECEEQSHAMAEEHAKYVQTMERRLRQAEQAVVSAQQQQQRSGTGGTPRSARMTASTAAGGGFQQTNGGAGSGGRSDSRPSLTAPVNTPNARVGGLSAASPLAPPPPGSIEGSSSFFEQVARQLDDINNREASRSAAIRQLL